MRRRFFGAILIFLLTVALFTPTATAKEAKSRSLIEKMPPEYADFLDQLPSDIGDLLPENLFSKDPEEVGAAVAEISDFSFLLHTLLDLIGLRLNRCVKLLASICGLLLLSAIASTVAVSLKNERVRSAFSLCSTLAVTLTLLSQAGDALHTVSEYFSNLGRVTEGALPLLGALYTLGGNTGAAAASASGLTVYMTLMEGLIGKSILPFCGICMGLALLGALDTNLRVGTLLGSIKKNYTTALAFLMTLLLAMLSGQTLLAARGDSLLWRGAKFAAGNMIPVVGGSVSELLRTVSTGVGYLRGAVGISGVLLLLLMLLPTLVELLLLRMTWQLTASIADLLGCATEKKLLDEFASLLGYLVTAVCICSSILLIAMAILAGCAAAVG